MSIKRFKPLETWIKEALSDSEKDGPCTALSVVYKKPEGGTKEIHSVKLSGKTWVAKDLADLFTGKAESFAQDLAGIQMFELLAFYGNRREEEASHNFRVVDGELSAGGASRGVRESPDATGMTAQLMRHLERKDETMLALVQGMTQSLMTRNVRLEEREVVMREELNDAYLLVREMIMKQKIADQQMEIERLRFVRDSNNQERMLAQAPALINTAAGKEVFPQSVVDTTIIEKLAAKIDPEKVDMLVQAGVISAEDAGPLKLRIEEFRAKQKREIEAVKELPPASGETLQ